MNFLNVEQELIVIHLNSQDIIDDFKNSALPRMTLVYLLNLYILLKQVSVL